MSAKPRLLDMVRSAIRVRHYSYRTEQQYIGWIRRYIVFHGLRHPREMGGPEIEQFLTHLARDRNVAAPTQTQALAALLFLYRHVLAMDLPWVDKVVRARQAAALAGCADSAGGASGARGAGRAYRGWSSGCSTAVACACWRRWRSG